MAYISQSELENYLKRSLTTEEASNFTVILAAVQEIIDNYCDTSFEEVSETSRYYDGGIQEIDIDPCTDVTAVAIVDEEFDVDETLDEDYYVVEPINRTIKTSIRLRSGKFSSGKANLKVTAKFSSYIDSVPELVKLACLKLCADVINNPMDYKSESIEGYSYQLRGRIEKDKELTELLAKYRQILI